MTSAAQTAANRRNSQKSTGPITESGRTRSRMNALQHGITRQVTIITDEARPAFIAYCSEIVADLAPETAHERRLAQSVAEDYWRLDRSRAAENNLFSLGHFEEAGNIDVDHAQIHAAFTQARVFREEARTLQLLTLYEQRINRTLHKNLELLRELQAERAKSQNRAIEKAIDLRSSGVEPTALRASRPNPTHQPNETEQVVVNGFVFSNAAIDHEIDRRHRYGKSHRDSHPTPQPLKAAA